jgi:hypothetical protein
MTELDLELKAASRRLMWSMGFSTRIDVPLRAFVAAAGNRKAYQEFTDLDVLGVFVAPDLRVHKAIVDCKSTGRSRSTERLFWVRGVADFFSADDAYMVRRLGVAAAARQLAGRLKIAVLTEADLTALQAHYPDGVGVDEGSVDFLFDPLAISRHRGFLSQMRKELEPLRDYQQYSFWVFEPFRNVQQLVAHLGQVSSVLDPQDRTHRALFFDAAWLYALTLAHAAHYVRRTSVTDVATSLQEYLFGGQLGLREKRQAAEILGQNAGRTQLDVDQVVLPPYYPRLLELVTRMLRRPGVVITVLRYAEWISEALSARVERPLFEAFPSSFHDVSAKRLADVCSFLVEAAGLATEFRSDARNLLAPLPRTSRSAPGAEDLELPKPASTEGSQEQRFLPLTAPES